MSVVTNLILKVSATDAPYEKDGAPVYMKALAAVRDYCLSQERLGWPDQPVDAVSGGTKRMEVECYAWGANYLDLAGFLDAVGDAPWRNPDKVQVLAQGDQDDNFDLYTLEEFYAPPIGARRRRWRVYRAKLGRVDELQILTPRPLNEEK